MKFKVVLMGNYWRVTMSVKVVTILIFLMVAMPFPSLTLANEIDQISAVKQTVESFCKAEFEGDEFDQRVKLIKYSQISEKKEKERTGPASPWVVFWNWDSFYIVSSYKILDAEIQNNHAVATIAYRRVAESKGKGEIISSYKENDIVKLNLINDGVRWWIFDPPPPRISLIKLIEIYGDELKKNTDKWFATASEQQKKSYFRKKETLNILKSLLN